MESNFEQLKKVVEGLGHVFFTGDLNINLIGVRTEDVITNEFDDELFVAIEIGGNEQVMSFKDFTTDPGFYYLKKKFLNPKGCAILKPGQYRGMWALGRHRGLYQALVQVGKCTVFRDRNKDNTVTKNTEDTGLFGINMHHAYDTKNNINKHSAGCQTHRKREQLGAVLGMCKASAKKYGSKFTYTLIMKADLPEGFMQSSEEE